MHGYSVGAVDSNTGHHSSAANSYLWVISQVLFITDTHQHNWPTGNKTHYFYVTFAPRQQGKNKESSTWPMWRCFSQILNLCFPWFFLSHFTVFPIRIQSFRAVSRDPPVDTAQCPHKEQKIRVHVFFPHSFWLSGMASTPLERVSWTQDTLDKGHICTAYLEITSSLTFHGPDRSFYSCLRCVLIFSIFLACLIFPPDTALITDQTRFPDPAG